MSSQEMYEPSFLHQSITKRCMNHLFYITICRQKL